MMTEESARQIQVILGTMTFGGQVTEPEAERMVGRFVERGYTRIDTAYRYNEGRTEEILGRILTPEKRKNIYLITKANPLDGGGLSPARLVEQVETSLTRLKTDWVDLLYLHQPDPETPVEDSLAAGRSLYEQGKIRALGLSNYASWQVMDVWHACRRDGWLQPVNYQGMYNAITRSVEPELLPALEKGGLSFYAYNPLAGGILAGRYTDPAQRPTRGRFSTFPFYLDRYWNETTFEALDNIRRACGDHGLTMDSAALRWLGRHSGLSARRGDGIIIGASRLEHLEANLNACEEGDLPGPVVQAVDRAWEGVRPVCPKYFRP